jgi:hypothetical protein
MLLGDDREKNNETTAAPRQQILNKQIYAAVAEQRLRKQTRSQGNKSSATIHELLELVFSDRSVPRGYQWDTFRV